MEYFLYGVAEADRLIEQIKVMEHQINDLADKVDGHEDEVDRIAREHYDLQRRPASSHKT